MTARGLLRLLNPKNSAVDPVAQEKEEKENRAAGAAQKRKKSIIGQPGANWTAGGSPEKEGKGESGSRGQPSKEGKALLGSRGQPRKWRNRRIEQPGGYTEKQEKDNQAAGGIIGQPGAAQKTGTREKENRPPGAAQKKPGRPSDRACPCRGAARQLDSPAVLHAITVIDHKHRGGTAKATLAEAEF